MRQVQDWITAQPHSLRCPFCMVYGYADHDSARCLFGEGFLSEGLLEALHRVPTIAGKTAAFRSSRSQVSPPGDDTSSALLD